MAYYSVKSMRAGDSTSMRYMGRVKSLAKVGAGLAYACRYWLRTRGKCGKGSTGRVLEIELHDYHHGRYFYAFVKAFRMEGIEVRLRCRLGALTSLARAEYGRLLLVERLVGLSLVFGKGGNTLRRESDAEPKQFIPTDLLPFDSGGAGRTVYDVPMAQHPIMYSSGYWNAPVDRGKVRSSILFVGNCDERVYGGSKMEDDFRVLGRPTIMELLRERADFREVCNRRQLEGAPGGTVDFVRTDRVRIPPGEFRHLLAGYRFFLCAPGAFMPLCHNLIEALSTGAVPVIERSYANLLEPPLEDGVNAIVFDGRDGLTAAIDRGLSMNPDEQKCLAAGAQRYYDEYLSPTAVVRRCSDPQVRTVRMLAGQHTMALRREQLDAAKA